MAAQRGLRLSSLELAGFRGIRGRVRLDLPPGYLVITGRNGSGKSSLCDAVEYALLGELHKYHHKKEAQESVDDYVWWRAEPQAEKRLVRLTLVDGGGHKKVVSRSDEPGGNKGVRDLAGTLCYPTLAPANCVDQLCRSALIRDEMIAAESLDLTEVQRYEFVRAATGTDVLPAVDRRSERIHKSLHKLKDEAKRDYDRLQEEASRIRSDLAEARQKASSVTDLDAAIRALGAALETEERGAKLPRLGRKRAAELRSEVKEIADLAARAAPLRSARQELDSAEARLARKEIESELADVESGLGELRRKLEAAEKLLAAARSAADVADSLAALRKHGRRVGLVDGGCPLCGAQQTKKRFAGALAALTERIGPVAEERERQESLVAKARKQIAALEEKRRELEDEIEPLAERNERLEKDLERITDLATGLGLELTPQMPAETFDDAINVRRDRARRIEKSLGILDASLAVERVRELEETLGSMDEACLEARQRLGRLEGAIQRFNAYRGGIRRAVGELVSERLDALGPLFGDLYLRLRPHVDWEKIRYRLRGQVNLMLSLEVGEALNPRFMFSSGQRRAAGLAFLLAVYLSRPWCRLRTLIVDDPVQHIDDYRSLHVVETLSAIRKAGHQVICTVEDPNLAELLARRLCTGPRPEGLLVEMRYRSGEGCVVAETRKIKPPSPLVLFDDVVEAD